MRSFALDLIALKVLTAPFILVQLILLPQHGSINIALGLIVLAFSTGWAVSHVVNKNEAHSLIERSVAASSGVAAFALILTLFVSQSSFEVTGLIIAPEALLPAKEIAKSAIINGVFLIAGSYVGGLTQHSNRN